MPELAVSVRLGSPPAGLSSLGSLNSTRDSLGMLKVEGVVQSTTEQDLVGALYVPTGLAALKGVGSHIVTTAEDSTFGKERWLFTVMLAEDVPVDTSRLCLVIGDPEGESQALGACS